MFEKYVELFACRVCREEKTASGQNRPCPESAGQFCPFIEKAKAETIKDIETDRILVKRGEIA